MNKLLRRIRKALAFLLVFTPAAAWPLSTGLVISQVYGGGGNTGAPYQNDFIELHNNSSAPISLAGMAVQYAGGNGSSWAMTPLPGVNVPAGGYYLIAASGGAIGMPLPTPDAVSMISMSLASGKVALTSDTTALSVSCPIGGAVIDFVGYGDSLAGTINCFEGMGPTGATTSSTGAIRNSNGCAETDNNVGDFTVTTPNPRNSASAPVVCAQTMNETNDPAEADYCVLQFPSSTTGNSGAMSELIYARLFEAGVTEGMGAGSWIAQIGYGPSGVDPATQAGYTWYAASFNNQIGNDDEYQAQFTLPAAGTYGYAARFSPDGLRWTYCDLDGAGSNMGLTFSSAQLGVMTVNGGGATAPGAPQMVSAQAANGQATVSFSAPASDGGSPITSYTVTSNPDGITGTGSFSPITVAGLTNGTPYTFTVTATNAIGTGAVSPASNSVTPSAFAAGLVISQVYGGGGLMGGLYQNDYVELHNNSAAPISLSGLAMQVSAATGAMWNVAPLPSASIPAGGFYLIAGASSGGIGMPLPTPDTANMIAINFANAKVALTYGTTAIVGTGCPISAGIIVDFVGYGMTDCAETSPASPLTASTAAVRFNNGCTDTDNNSADFSGTTPNPRNSTFTNPCVSAPGAPLIGSAAAGHGYATVTFMPPLSDGGSPVTSYTVTSNPGAITATGSGSPITVTGLTNGTPYTFTVTATNAIGTGTASAPSNSVTPAAITGIVISQFFGGGGQAGATFTNDFIELHNNTAGPISLAGMAVQSAAGTGAMWQIAALPAVSIPSGGYYLIAGNSSGANGVALPAPDATLTISLGTNSGKVALTSHTASLVGNCPLGGTVIDFVGYGMADCKEGSNVAPGTTASQNAVRNNNGCTDTNQNGADFSPQIPPAPRNSSNNFSCTATVPGAPVIGTATAGNTQATVAFTAPASNGGSAITSYTVTSNPGGLSASGASSPITVTGLTNGTAYTFTVTATNAVGTGPASAASNSVTPLDPNPPRLGNISTRMQVLTGNDVMIGGFVIGGSTNKTVAIVATGPSLAAFGITNALANPTLRLVRSSDQVTIGTNDDWQAAPNQAQLTAAGFAPSNALEAAILVSLPPGAYTAIVEGAGGGTGVAVVGVYEVDGPQIPLINISTRGRVLTGNDVMIGGFVIQGSGPQTVAIVATGPSLAQFGIASPLANPSIQLVRSSDQAVLATNDNWQDDVNNAQLQAAGFAPSNALESGLYRTLPPGAYTVIVQGVGGGTGVAVIGVYKVN